MYDIAIIGSGPGGYVAAIKAVKLGMKVAIIEKGDIGGVCLNRGCIPTKAMIASAHILENINRAAQFGIEAGAAKADMKKIQERKQTIVGNLRKGIEQLLKANKIELIKGDARFTAPSKIEVNGSEIDAKNILIAAGSVWAELPGFKVDGEKIITSDHALDMTELPQEMIILGGGVIGCEFACMLNAFGVKVTIVEAMDSILPLIEKSVTRLLARSMKKSGIELKTKTTIDEVSVDNDKVIAKLSSGETLEADKLMVSIGRKPNPKMLNVKAADIELTERKFIKVNEDFKTSCDGVYAIGDIIGGWMLAHEASAEAISCVSKIAGHHDDLPDLQTMPSPIFTMPEIGSVGMTEEQIKEKGIDYVTGRFPYLASGKALCDGETEGQAIIFADKESGKLLGIHIFGKDATSLLSEATLAVSNGLTARDIEKTIHAHPTLNETLAEAAADVYGAAIHKL